MKKLIVKTTTTLGDTPGFPPVTMEWPIDQFRGQTLDRVFANSVRVTVEKEDGTVCVYEPEWREEPDPPPRSAINPGETRVVGLLKTLEQSVAAAKAARARKEKNGR